MKNYSIVILLLIGSLTSSAQRTKSVAEEPILAATPGLVVGIVIDQMRFDYIYKYWNKLSDNGFKRLVKEGFEFTNANFNFVPTYTAPGHAGIFTGTTPAYNGIISNEWFDPKQRKTVYCVGDSTVMPLGTTSISGKMSPRNLLTTTVTDELRLSTNMLSKVIGISLKDRGAILPAGQSANAAYWHDPYTNNWISSTYYMKQLPSWVNDFNKRKMSDSLLSKKWTTLLPIEQYTESTSDDNAYEGLFDGEIKPVFPHDLPALKEEESELIRATPFGNIFTNEFAMSAIRNENLGKGKATDFITISFSSPDYVGHKFGTNAIELQDTYLRLDRDIAAFLNFLDKWTGNNYLLFLTSDHGAALNPRYAQDCGINASQFESNPMVDTLKKFIKQIYGSDTIIANASAHNIHLNKTYIDSKNLNLEEIQKKCAAFVTKLNGVAVAMTATEMSRGICRTGIYSLMQNGYNVKRSADVMIQLLPGWVDWYYKTGTTHGSGYSYDTHVPLIFFGKKIKTGSTSDPVYICDIAPTISTLLNIEFPSGNVGKPLDRYFK